MPDEVSKKSLKVLDRKLEWLAQHAKFDVNINSVLGGGMAHPEDALTITRRALELGFETTVGIIHDHDGQLDPLKPNERAVYDQILKERKPAMFAFAYDNLFHKNLALGQAQRLAMPCRQPLPLYLRTGPGALLLAAKGISRHSPGKLQPGRSGSRILDREALCAVLHRILRAPGGHARPHAQPAARSPDPLFPTGDAGWAAATCRPASRC